MEKKLKEVEISFLNKKLAQYHFEKKCPCRCGILYSLQQLQHIINITESSWGQCALNNRIFIGGHIGIMLAPRARRGRGVVDLNSLIIVAHKLTQIHRDIFLTKRSQTFSYAWLPLPFIFSTRLIISSYSSEIDK